MTNHIVDDNKKVIDLDALEKLADEATPGEWRRAIYSRERVIVAGPTSKAFMKVLSKPPHSNGKDCPIQADANAAFILGVQPATIKALIAELKEARECLQRFEWSCEQLAHTRSQASYDQMISDGQAQELLELDNARRATRAFLARNGKGEG